MRTSRRKDFQKIIVLNQLLGQDVGLDIACRSKRFAFCFLHVRRFTASHAFFPRGEVEVDAYDSLLPELLTLFIQAVIETSSKFLLLSSRWLIDIRRCRSSAHSILQVGMYENLFGSPGEGLPVCSYENVS